ncbi:FxSxx-COOH system tetratricopeptide repeat protein [Catenuloplanes indicus]|uniref:Tetratricopeptide (TPR) repeat protein n=1 Tax=Catenuloplanes indicus TaxID=137267 RepID=A0AAE3W3U1_9ACTN|nr:FxSxx-COOH system tetratricopeptide repeat protein [Catenuloplanes indicus]MDQ0368876.1 tetratricopeptide (TPR) repeat protein [Catenuloplanes indicus]
MAQGDFGAGGSDGPRAELVAELQLLYRAAGRPAYRRVSAAIGERDDMPDTVSHETVSAILRGEWLSRWIKVECVVRQLATMAVHRPTLEFEVRRFHSLWLAADDAQRRRDSAGTGTALPGPLPGVHLPEGPSGEGLPQRNPSFTGRHELLDRVTRELAEEPLRPVVLYGLGGMGKTQLAAEFAHRRRTDFDRIWWIPAEQPSSALAEMTRIADQLDVLPSRSAQQTVRTVLNRLESGGIGRWLLVYDNAGPVEEIESFMPRSGGDVLVTTRDAASWRDRGRLVEVDVFQRPESVELLRERGHRISFSDAERLADFLGDMPLAMEQVAAMQSYTRTPVGEYIAQLENRAAVLLAQGRPTGYSETVASAFGLAYERLRRESFGAAQLLDVLSCLAAEPIPLVLLSRAGGTAIPDPLGRILDDPVELEAAVWRLGRYGLVRVGEDAQRVEVHRLVQLIVRDVLSSEELRLARASAHRLLSLANPGEPGDPVTWDMHSQLRRHVTVSGLIENMDPDARRTVIDQARYLSLYGDPSESVRLAGEALAAWTAGGAARDELTYQCRRRQLDALYMIGDYEAATEVADTLWEEIREDGAFAADNDLRIGVMVQVARQRRSAGRYVEALELERTRLKSMPSDDQARVLGGRSNEAVSLRLLGDFAAALEIDRSVAAERERLFGAVNYWTMLSESNVARDLYGLGRYREALEIMERVVPMVRRELGARHDHALIGARTLAIAARKTGDLDRALAESREHYLNCQGTYRADHENTLAAVMTYANTLAATGQHTSAWDLATMAIHRYRRSFGDRNPLSLAASINLGIIQRAQGEARKARQIDRLTLDALRQTLGAKHPYALAASMGLANDLAMVHEEESAAGLLADTFELMCEVRGEDHPETLTCAANHGLLGARSERVPGLAETLGRLEELLGADHPHVSALRQGQRGECDVEPPPT